ncbi:MAG: LarC family nickel insertion protein [Myxococcota bacterium]
MENSPPQLLPTRFDRLHFVSVGGAAGDMLLAALIDLGADLRTIVDTFESMQEPGLELHVERVNVNNEQACHVRSIAKEHGRHHTHLKDIMATIDRGTMSDAARDRAKRIFEILARAEAEVHGGGEEDVHLHEVGELDSIMDVVGIAVALETLGNPKCTCSPLSSGKGIVQTSHGPLQCPVPAVCKVSHRWSVPLVDTDIEGETITPTGISALAQMCSSFTNMETHNASAKGVGAGTRRFVDLPNVLRVFGWN